VRDTDVTVAHAEVGPECRAERMLARTMGSHLMSTIMDSETRKLTD
jgi:hypothetical protein